MTLQATGDEEHSTGYEHVCIGVIGALARLLVAFSGDGDGRKQTKAEEKVSLHSYCDERVVYRTI